LLSLNQAVDTVFAALREGKRGETYIPRVPAARITDIAAVLIGDRPIEITYTGIRPGEKLHEILISEEEAYRVADRGDYYAIFSLLPELSSEATDRITLEKEYSSADNLMSRDELRILLAKHNLLQIDQLSYEGELLR
jgi:UDP-glucose 4-epimerase